MCRDHASGPALRELCDQPIELAMDVGVSASVRTLSVALVHQLMIADISDALRTWPLDLGDGAPRNERGQVALAHACSSRPFPRAQGPAAA